MTKQGPAPKSSDVQGAFGSIDSFALHEYHPRTQRLISDNIQVRKIKNESAVGLTNKC
jgi:hypothetical protein